MPPAPPLRLGAPALPGPDTCFFHAVETRDGVASSQQIGTSANWIRTVKSFRAFEKEVGEAPVHVRGALPKVVVMVDQFP